VRDEGRVRRIMLGYAQRTGVSASDRSCVRYLWTDAFAVCNFLGLYEATGDAAARDLALALVDRVHRVLGRHRPDDPRRGWISGLSEAEGEAHPTRGGLRIGKPLAERAVGAPPDEATEWDRDGQYFHYLTRWMHALGRVAQVTGDEVHHRHACELAQAAYAGFLHRARDGRAFLCWKMSIDLSRPLVAASGQHDPLDGLVTYDRLQARSVRAPAPDLRREIGGLAKLCAGRAWDTDDALGIGGLLCDAVWLIQLVRDGVTTHGPPPDDLLAASRSGLETLLARGAFDGSAERRLAFRELGLSIGLRAVAGVAATSEPRAANAMQPRVAAQCEELARYLALADDLERFWLDPAHRRCRSWTEHMEINEVMLATSLDPAGYLGVG